MQHLTLSLILSRLRKEMGRQGPLENRNAVTRCNTVDSVAFGTQASWGQAPGGASPLDVSALAGIKYLVSSIQNPPYVNDISELNGNNVTVIVS